MKMRRVVVTIEMETNLTLKVMREYLHGAFDFTGSILNQIQMNVIKPKSKSKRR